MFPIKPGAKTKSGRSSQLWFWPAVVAVVALGSVSAIWVSTIPQNGFTLAANEPTGLAGSRLHEHGLAGLVRAPGLPHRADAQS